MMTGTTSSPTRYSSPRIRCSNGIQPMTQRKASSVKIRKYFMAAA